MLLFLIVLGMIDLSRADPACLTCEWKSRMHLQPEVRSAKTLNEINRKAQVDSAVKAFREAGKTCPDRIWPGLDMFQKTTLVFVDAPQENPMAPPTISQAWVWNENGQTGDPKRLDAEELMRGVPVKERNALLAPYAKSIWKQSPSLILSLNTLGPSERNPTDSTFTVGFHEAFHMFVQGPQGWPKRDESILRGTEYPAEVAPRNFRAQQIRTLKLAVEARDTTTRERYLSEAKYWSEQYRKNPEESKKTRETDIGEGSARYVEAVADAIGSLGCGASEADIRRYVLEHLPKDLGEGAFPDGEGYEIGLLSGMLMREKGPKGWEKSLVEGKTPDEILFQGVTSRVATADPTLAKTIQQRIDSRNAQSKSEVEPFVKGFSSSEYVKISVPRSSLSGSVGHMGYIVPKKEFPGGQIAAKAMGNWKGSSFDLSLEGQSVLNQLNNKCGTQQTVILVAKSDLEKIQPPKAGASPAHPVQGSLPQNYSERLGKDGWLCLN